MTLSNKQYGCLGDKCSVQHTDVEFTFRGSAGAQRQPNPRSGPFLPTKVKLSDEIMPSALNFKRSVVSIILLTAELMLSPYLCAFSK